jgi:tetratricopeptide (TPR) repeat protein
MTRHHQLKNEARRAEHRSDWARAIELYKSAIRLEEEHGLGSDVGVYNRVGDLYLRQGDTAAAVEYYEQAADRYATNGLHTSAIALCNKILRISPELDEEYGRLALLHASTG